MQNAEHAVTRLEHLALLEGKSVADLRPLIGKRGFAGAYVSTFDRLMSGMMFDGRSSRRVRRRIEELISEHESPQVIPVQRDAPPKLRYPKYMRPYLRRMKKESPEKYELEVARLLECYTHESVFYDDRRSLSMD